MRGSERIIVIGAGIGGLAAALDLAVQGCDVLVVEKAAVPGGKMRAIEVGGRAIDAGPTVFTMRWVFEELFAAAGATLAEHVTLKPADVLARHAWSAHERLDIYADMGRSAAAIARLAGPAEGERYTEFCARARAAYETLKKPFILSPQPSPMSLTLGAGLRGLGDLWRISPFVTLWHALGNHFHDSRLRQLFGRYATYCGSSPFEAPATLMLVAHVEREGVWLVDGGMHQVAAAVARLAAARGAAFRYATEAKEILVSGGKVSGVEFATGERLACDAVIVNADATAVASGLLGRSVERAVYVQHSMRSLSALTWTMLAETAGFRLSHHNVFFSSDYEAEFDDIFRRYRLPVEPTVYVCAQDRNDQGATAAAGPERLLVLVNAPATGDVHPFERAEIEQCRERAFGLLERCGLAISTSPQLTVATSPCDFARLYPGTGGALYGQASHGWGASFTRPTARTHIPGLYLAGGSTHPGPGVPMAALSGRLAAARVLSDLTSTSLSRRGATSGGTSMP